MNVLVEAAPKDSSSVHSSNPENEVSQEETKKRANSKGNKSSLMTTTETTTLQKLNNEKFKNDFQIKREIFYSQNLTNKTHKVNKSIASINKFDINFPGFEREVQDVSQYINESNKDQDVIVNISQLDLDRSMIKGIENMETIFKNTENDLIESDKRLSTEMSYDIKSNTNKNEEKKSGLNLSVNHSDTKTKDKVKLIKTDINKNNKSKKYKWMIISVIFILVITVGGIGIKLLVK